MLRELTIDKKKITVTLVMDLETPPTPSKSGKTLILASTRGNQLSETKYDGSPITAGVNVYVPNK